MRHLSFLPVLLFTFISHAQPTIKTVPGVFINNVLYTDGYSKVSSSGNSIALRRGSYQSVLFDVQKNTMTQADRGMSNISRDHRYTFSNDTYVARWNENKQPCWAREIKSVGLTSDTLPQRLPGEYYALDMDEKSNFIATKIWIDSIADRILGMKGLYTIDRRTGAVLQTLREDTLFHCKDRYNGCWTPAFYLQKNYLGVSAKSYLHAIDIYPFNATPKFSIAAHDYHTVKADSLYLFTIGDSTLFYNRVKAFDTRTGELIAKKWYSRLENFTLRFETYRNKLYYFRREAGLVLEETVNKDTIITTKSWDVATLTGLSKDQQWYFAVAKGPSFFLAPISLQKGEAGGIAANTAHIIQAPSNKISLQVYPFFNRTQNDIAKQEKDLKAEKAFIDRIAREKDSIAHPERYCHLFWNTKKYYRGRTIFWGGAYMIEADYDCKNDKYKLWRPAQLYNGNGHYMQPEYVMVPGGQFRDGGEYYSRKKYVTCTECDGDGTYQVTTYTTKTKDLPWGYFSGIETKKVTTTSRTTTMTCKKCMGNGVALE